MPPAPDNLYTTVLISGKRANEVKQFPNLIEFARGAFFAFRVEKMKQLVAKRLLLI
jgi:hypothetical protein